MTNEPTTPPVSAPTNGAAKAIELPAKGPLPIRPDDRLPPCPFCGSSITGVVAVPFDSDHNTRVIVCTKCGAQGPSRWPPANKLPLDLVEARSAWTARTQPK